MVLRLEPASSTPPQPGQSTFHEISKMPSRDAWRKAAMVRSSSRPSLLANASALMRLRAASGASRTARSMASTTGPSADWRRMVKSACSVMGHLCEVTKPQPAACSLISAEWDILWLRPSGDPERLRITVGHARLPQTENRRDQEFEEQPADHEKRRQARERKGGEARQPADHDKEGQKAEAAGMEFDVGHGAPEQDADAEEQPRQEAEMAFRRDADP